MNSVTTEVLNPDGTTTITTVTVLPNGREITSVVTVDGGGNVTNMSAGGNGP